MRKASLLLSTLVLCQLAHSATINVPGDQATIAAAVTAASDGDLITVNAGTYAVVVDLSKAVTLRLLGNVTVNSFTGLATSSIDLQGFTLATTDATNFSYPGQIIGSGGLAKLTGAGTMTLSGNNAYSGPTTLSGGSIIAGSNNALGTSALTINTTATRLIVANGITIPNNITLNSPAGTAGRGAIEGPTTGTGTINGTINIIGATTSGGHLHGGTDGTTTNTTNPGLILNGAITSNVAFNQRDGIITYNGGGTYTGFSFTGTANVGANGLSSTAVVTLGVSGGATLNINGAQALAGLTFNANTCVVATGANTLTLNGDVTQTNNNGVTISGKLNLGGGVRTFNITQNTTTVSADITNGGITKEGASVLVLSGNSNFAAGVTVNAGRVTISGSNALGIGTTTLNPGALQLLFSATATVSNPIVINGVLTNNNAIQGPASPLIGTLAGPITINATIGGTGGHFNGGHTTTTGGLVVSGAITSSVPVVHTGNNAVYSGGGTYSSFVVNTGTIATGAANGINPSAVVTMGITGGATWNVNFNQSLAGLVLGNSAGGTTGGTGTVTIATGMTLTMNGDVTTYADFAHAINQPGTLDLNGTRNFIVNDSTQINDLSINAIIGNGTLVKSGAGQLTLGTSTSTYAGGTRVMSGTLSADTDVRLGAVPGVATPGNLQINDTAIFEWRGNVALDSKRGIAIGNVSGTGTGTSTITVTGANTLTYAGIIANNGGSTGNLVVANTGTLQLNAANTYTGTTVINEARMRLLGNAGTILGTTSITVNTSGVLEVDGNPGADLDRIGNSVPVTLNSSVINFTTAAATLRSESIDVLTVNGASQISMVANTTGDARLTTSNLVVNGTLTLFRLQADGTTAELGNLFSTATANSTAFANVTVFQGAAFFPSGIYSTVANEGLIGSGTAQSVFISRNSTDWTTTTTWTPPGVGLDADGIPDSDDIVIIRNGDNVIVTAAACAAKGIIFNSPGTGNGTISGTNTLTVGGSGIVINAISAPSPLISCNLSFGGANATITNNSTNQFQLGNATNGSLSNTGILTLNGRGQTQVHIGNGGTANSNALKAGTFCSEIQVAESTRLRLLFPNPVTTQEDVLQKITFTGGALLDRNFNVVRASGTNIGLLNFPNVHLGGGILSVFEENINVRMSIALEGNATVQQTNGTSSSDIDFYDITNSTGVPYTLTMTGAGAQNLDTVLFGNVNTNVTLDLVRCNMDFGTSATTAGQIINGTVRLATTGLGTLDIFTGRLGTGLVTGSGKFVIGGGRTIRGLAQEVGSGTRAVNDIQVKVEVPAGQSARLQTERNNDDTLNGWVRFNVEMSAGSSVDIAGIGNATRLLTNFNVLGASTFTNSNNSTEVFVGNVTGSSPLTIAGANQTRIIGALGPNTSLVHTGTGILELTDRITELTASNFGSMDATSLITLDPAGTGALYFTVGNAGTNCIGGGLVDVQSNRTIRGVAAEVGSGTRALNTIDALFLVRPGLTPLFETERANDSTLEGWVRFSRVEVGTGATINTNLNNVTRMVIDMTLQGNANYVNSDDGTGMFVGNVNGTGDLTVSGTQNTRFIGALSSNANVVITNTGTSVLQDSTTELVVPRVFSFGGRTVTSATNGVLILRRNGGAGTIELPTGNTGELRIEAGQDGLTDMITSGTIINTNARTIRTYIQDDAGPAKTNTMAGIVNATGAVSVISDRIGTDTTNAGTVLYTNLRPTDSATIAMSRTNDLKLLADIMAPASVNGAIVTTGDATNCRVRNVTGLPTSKLIAGGTNAIFINGTTTATLGANTSATVTINKASPTFLATTGVFPGLYFNGGTIQFLNVAGADTVESVGDVVVNAGTTNILTLTPTATGDVRVTAATLTAPVGTSLRYNRNVTAPNTSNFYISGVTNGTVFTNVHINGTTGGSYNSTTLEAGFATGLTTIQPIANFLITGPAVVQVGETANFTVTARDATNATVPSYNGTVSFSITNPAQITMTQNPYTFVGGGGAGDAGVHTFAVRFDSGAGATQALAVTDGTRFASILVQINRGQPSITWPNATINYGDLLNGTVLNAVAVNLSGNTVPGTYVYNPGPGTALNVGANQPVSVTFVPSDVSNYDGANGTAQITVQPRPLTISPNNTTRTYGQPNAPTATITGFVNGDDQGDLPGLTFNTAATQASTPGVFNVTVGGAVNPNYSISYTGNPATLTVTPAPLTVTANTLIARINLPIPALTLSYTGFVLGQDASVLETQAALTTTATQGNPIGDYPITFTTTPVDTDGNYTITTVNGIMHIYPLQALVDNKTVSAGTGIATPVAMTGTSFSVNALTFSIATQPAHGTVTIVGNNAIYTSFPGYSGPDSFTYRGFDGFDFSLPATVTVTVKPAPTVTSQPTFVPNPALAGAPLTATAATDNGTISWNFGDGTAAQSGSTVTHTYAAPGLYTAVVTITSPEGLVTTTTVTVFVGFDLTGGSGAANPPGVTGILVGGAGAGKLQGGTGKISCNYVKREKTYYQGSLGKLNIPTTLTQDMLTNMGGVLTIGSGTNAALFQFSLTKTGKGKSTGLPTIEFSIKKKAFKFKAQRADLTTLTEALGGPRKDGVKKGEIVTLLIPVTLQIGDKVFLAMTFQVKYQQINAGGKGSL